MFFFEPLLVIVRAEVAKLFSSSNEKYINLGSNNSSFLSNGTQFHFIREFVIELKPSQDSRFHFMCEKYCLK